MSLQGKRILLGVSGGIACYKAVHVVRELTAKGAEVHVAMTKAAQQFVGKLTFEALSHHKVLTDPMELDDASQIVHVELGRDVDLIVVAPATCDILARLAHGFADDPIGVTVLASPAPLLVVPAMDHHMWLNAATQSNLAILRNRGVKVLEPLQGPLASGAIGWGRMQEPEAIVAAIASGFEPGPLTGKRLLVTAGGTQEPIDPVRYIGNRSSGKMGLAVAEEAAARGADVTVVFGAISIPLPAGVTAVHTPTAAEMAKAVIDLAPDMDGIVMAAAVADYRPAAVAGHKIKRTQDELTLQLTRTDTILGAIAGLPLVRVGFAAETQNLVENARNKLERSKLDLIVGNDVSAAGSGFGTDTNQVVLIDPEGLQELPLMSKRAVAEAILDRVQTLLASRSA